MEAGRLLEGLDLAQREAVMSPGAPLCVLAGAGSGKTRVLTRRIARRCFDGSADAGHVLLLTSDELAAADEYEVDDYTRVRARLASGTEAWVYVQRSG